MRTLDELQQGCAAMLVKYRQLAKLSRARLAALTGIDERRVKRFEEGNDAPRVPEFFAALDAIGVPAFPLLLEYIHPSEYSNREPGADATRARVAHYVQSVATERLVRQLDYLFVGQHGSNLEPQMQLITLINHLPLAYRVIICKQALAFWELATLRGETINPADVMPDVELLRATLVKAEAAVAKQQQAYNAASR